MIEIFLLIIGLFFILIYFSKRQGKKKLEILAYVDEITGGNNWNKFKSEATFFLEQSGNEKYTMIILDVDRFRFINEEYGHLVGDKLLKLIMGIIDKNINEKETACRLTADIFVILSQGEEEKILIKKMTKFAELINQEKYALEIKETIACRFGVYGIEDKTEDLSKAREKANMAKIEAKKNRTEPWFFYSTDFRKKIAEEKEIEDRMEYALENEEFELYLQPKYSLRTDSYCGAEALVRWNHKEKGLIYPNDFIPIFERNGFITKLDIFMVEEACKVLLKWKTEWFPCLSISVNISRKNLFEENFIENVVKIAEKYDIEKKRLELELTESCVFDDVDLMIKIGERLRSYGFEISMDDFGAGYSSVNLLETLPLNTVKMDRGFFEKDIKENRRLILIKSVVDLIKKLEMEVVAEGIETEEEVKVLKEIKCDIIQGYYYGKPMPVDAFEKHIFKSEKI